DKSASKKRRNTMKDGLGTAKRRRASRTFSLLGVLLLVIGFVPLAFSAGSSPLQLPMRGDVRVIGYVPGQEDHKGKDYYAVDLTSNNTTVYPTAPGYVAYSDINCETSGQYCYANVVVIDH